MIAGPMQMDRRNERFPTQPLPWGLKQFKSSGHYVLSFEAVKFVKDHDNMTNTLLDYFSIDPYTPKMCRVLTHKKIAYILTHDLSVQNEHTIL